MLLWPVLKTLGIEMVETSPLTGGDRGHSGTHLPTCGTWSDGLPSACCWADPTTWRSGGNSRQRFRSLPLTSRDRKSTRLNSSHLSNSYAVFCFKKKKQNK